MPTTPKQIEHSTGSLSVELGCVPPDKVSVLWPFVRQRIEDAVNECGDWTAQEIYDQLLKGDMLLWLAISDAEVKAAATTQLTETKHGKICTVIACAGKRLGEWAHFISTIETYAKGEGCKLVRLGGRKGWARVFPDYEMVFVTLEKAL